MKRLSVFILAVMGLFMFARCGSDDSTSPTNPTGSATKYQISISAVPSEGGSVSPDGGKYKKGKKLGITATPADSSWQFDRWSGDCYHFNWQI
jgi:hypothetical protein